MSGYSRGARALLLATAAIVTAGSLIASAPVAGAAQPLAGRVITLDPGHNGGSAAHPEQLNRLVYAGGGVYKPCNAVGTETRGGYSEHAFTWDVANRVAELLRARGARVVFTRSSDTGVGPCVDVRPAIANRAGSDAVVSIHGDGNVAAGARGFHVIEPVAPPVSAGVRTSSDRLARALRSAFRSTTGIPYANYLAGGDGLDARSDLGSLNLSTRPVVFIECGNMKSAADVALMGSPAGRQRIAEGIRNGVAAFLRR